MSGGPLPAKIAFVGLPGAGKSSIGRRLAGRLGLPFGDLDEAIEARLGCSVREYFERDGEPAFRDLEARTLVQLAASTELVLATGGGAVLRADNRTLLRDHFHVIYLRASPEDLMRRLRHDIKRPLLQVADPLERLRELHGQRDALYAKTAHSVVGTGRASLSRMVATIIETLERDAVPPAPGGPGLSAKG
ncbi:MAG: shikimate kinase [Variovorax sp.]